MEKFTTILRNDPNNFTEVEVGDYKQEKFYNQIKLKRWNNESNFSLRLIQNYPVEFSAGKHRANIIITLKEKIKTLSYSLVHKDVIFIKKTRRENSIVNIPDEAINSYTVMKKNYKLNIQGKTIYGCNRVGDIYAPKAVDDNGDFIYLDQNIVNDVLIVDVDNKWFDTAKYPIKIY